jgi:hypothetical protein
MDKEALKLVLEALEAATRSQTQGEEHMKTTINNQEEALL